MIVKLVSIMDLRDELMLSREIMQTVVRDRSSPWKTAVETLLTSKKQLLEDITKKQILTNRWTLEEREHQEFEKTLGWPKFSKEDTARVELGEISHEEWIPLGSGRARRSIQLGAMGSRLSSTARANRGFRRTCNRTGDNENNLHQNH